MARESPARGRLVLREQATETSLPADEDCDPSEAGLVCMKDALDLPPDAEEFDISDQFAEDAAADQCRYAFRRHVRGSVMMRLGMAPTAAKGAGSGTGNIEDVYAKTSDEFAEKMYMAMMLGLGSMELSKGMARCGYIMGLVFFGCLSAVHLFLCHRLSELPHHFRRNVEKYGDLARETFNFVGWKVVIVLITMSWFGTCTIYLTDCFKAVDTVFGCGQRIIPAHYKFLLFFPLLPLVFRTNAASLRRASIVSLYSMFAMGGIEALAAVYNGVTDHMGEQTVEHTAVPFKKNSTSIEGGFAFRDVDLFRMTNGLKCFVLAFSGIAALPYVIAEMTMPQNAKIMITKAWRKITIWQCTVAVLCYFGWGDNMASGSRDPLNELIRKAEQAEEAEDTHRQVIFKFTAILICILMMLKTIATFPLCFWPLCRELLGAIPEGGNRKIDMELQLPWAVERARVVEVCVRVAMLVLALVPAFLDDYSKFKTFMTCGPSSFVNFALPALFALLGILSHRSEVQRPRSLAEMKQMATGALSTMRITVAARVTTLAGRGSATPGESAGMEMATAPTASTWHAPSRRTEAPARGRAPGEDRSGRDASRACGSSGRATRATRAVTPPGGKPADQFLFMHSIRIHIIATGVLTFFTIVFTVWNAGLGVKKLLFGPDKSYTRDSAVREGCTSWFS